ncbi:MAG: icmV [Gammaproteobacteria bacterium]|jgi:intracellular multiplication protein IcmV|nr:icmV [Gammaproteobacteria bacterium]
MFKTVKSIFSGFRMVFLPRIHLKGLIGVDELKETSRAVKDIAKDTFTITEAKRQETFVEATHRLKLTPQTVAMRHRRFVQLAYSFLGMALLCFAYAIYLAFQGEVFAFLLGLAVTGLGLMYAFRYHFFAFQIKHRKLGCSLKEWWNGEVEKADTRTVKKTDE